MRSQRPARSPFRLSKGRGAEASAARGRACELLQHVKLAVDEANAIADAQAADLLAIEVANAAVVEADRDAVDLVVAARPLLDRVAGDAAGDRAADRRQRATAAGAELVADDAETIAPRMAPAPDGRDATGMTSIARTTPSSAYGAGREYVDTGAGGGG